MFGIDTSSGKGRKVRSRVKGRDMPTPTSGSLPPAMGNVEEAEAPSVGPETVEHADATRVDDRVASDRLEDASAAFADVVNPDEGREITDPREKLTEKQQRERRKELEEIAMAQRYAEDLAGIRR